MRRLLSVSLLGLFLATLVAVVIWQQYQKFLYTPLGIGPKGIVLNVEAGTNIRSVIMSLEEEGVTHMDWRWRLLNRLEHKTIKTGEYRLEPGTLPRQLLNLLDSGKVISYRFTIVEGWSVKELLAALGRNIVLEHTIETVEELKGLEGMPAGNPEGWFLPETYSYVRGDSDVQILRRAHKDMKDALSQVWLGRDMGLPYETQDELLTMASIIEKETSVEGERADIAGVFVRRLQERWRLETDPTVIYGMGDAYQGNIRRQDLKRDTPYNTYTRHGLPPTPIALPGLASLRAAAHPAPGEAMFFVANGKGGHTFSITLDEHNKAVRAYIAASRNKKPGEPGTKE